MVRFRWESAKYSFSLGGTLCHHKEAQCAT